MKTRALLLALPLLAVAGCRDNRSSVNIQMVCSPTQTCIFSATCTTQYIGFPTLDTNGPGEAWMFLQVNNQLAANQDVKYGKLNTNDVHLDQAVIEYDGVGLGRDVYDLPNFVVPTGGTTVISVKAIRPVGSNLATLRAAAPTATPRMIVANVRLRGYTLDGARLETGDFPIGIQVCTGCLPTDPCPGENACPLPGMEPVACGTGN